ncbi:hypothetical protein MASR1M101_11820 [Gemmatimonas sp.]
MGCDTVVALLPDYARGNLAHASAWQVEWHVAHCPECERQLAAVAPIPAVIERDPQLVASVPLADVERYAMREAARRAITQSANGSSRRYAVVVAAAALLAVVVWRGSGGWFTSSPRGQLAAATASTHEPSLPAVPLPSAQTSAPMATAVALANANASPEFLALREAARELEQALAAAPDKGALNAFRDALEERRRELELRVVRVTE